MVVRNMEPHGALEILPVTLLQDYREIVTRLRLLAADLRIGLGWHYLLDLSWIIDKLGSVSGATVLDAGAGWGLMQWYLCEQGAQVISVDRTSRADLQMRLRGRYHVGGLRAADLEPWRRGVARELRADRNRPRSFARQVRNLGEASRREFRRAHGEVIVYNQDLGDLRDIPSSSIDAVVAVSALEHNQPGDLAAVVKELRRVLVPGGKLLATLGAAPVSDWFHEPSRGWCYTEPTLRRIFGLDAAVKSNYSEYDRLFSELRACAELRDNLASFYFKSGNNGMPWGVWDPQYQSVGVLVTKTAAQG
jgi:ubiquinone/menaquinone biosynthesis C-methylase UbiE